MLAAIRHHREGSSKVARWSLVRSSDAARGVSASYIVLLRDPTPEERRVLEVCLSEKKNMAHIDTLVEKAWMYDDLCK